MTFFSVLKLNCQLTATSTGVLESVAGTRANRKRFLLLTCSESTSYREGSPYPYQRNSLSVLLYLGSGLACDVSYQQSRWMLATAPGLISVLVAFASVDVL